MGIFQPVHSVRVAASPPLSERSPPFWGVEEGLRHCSRRDRTARVRAHLVFSVYFSVLEAVCTVAQCCYPERPMLVGLYSFGPSSAGDNIDHFHSHWHLTVHSIYRQCVACVVRHLFSPL